MNKKTKRKINEFILKLKYKPKFNKFNIKESLIGTYDLKDTKDLLELIDKSKTKEDFINNVKEFCKSNDKNFYINSLLIGNFLGCYDFVDNSEKINPKFINNFNNKNFDKIYEILKNNFYEYVISNNKYKNIFSPRKDMTYDYTKDINKEEIELIFENAVKFHKTYVFDLVELRVIYGYLLKTLGNYSIDDICNNFDFVKSDLDSDNEKKLFERQSEFKELKNLSDIERKNIKEIDLLEERLKLIQNENSKVLLERLYRIKDNLIENIDELNDIYLEYEILLREDIVDKLYIPSNELTVVDNYLDLKPQLIHMFVRNPAKFRRELEEKIKESIIKERKNDNYDEELTEEEYSEFIRRKSIINAELDQTQVNYSFEPIGHYTDSSGFRGYKSDTSNQIAASIYSAEYFLNAYKRVGLIGIGFNKEGLTPEAIALSSSSYLTTNMGLNNIEYNENKEFDRMSAPYEELKENDGKSEVVMFRRNMDYDTKASYIFCTIDSSDEKKSKEILERCRELNKSSKLKLVVYDLYKIRKSYEDSLKEKEEHVIKEPTKTR